ncbi:MULTISPECIES: TetR/AcrR family transcriptional regulator [unclassified Paenibacillus]|uniref:TetR/AcrR family transcriptional regulator n=1 Tax=unclassified Paenibacillus TaxID=185978 RepID=UPI002F428BE1
MKERIMETAKELFVKNGYNATTTGDIVKFSRSSKGNLYHHFGTKENLFIEIIKNEEEKWIEVWLEEEKKCNTNREKFIRINELCANVDYYYPLQLAMLEFYSRDIELQSTGEKVNEVNRRYMELFMNIFKAGNEAKEWQIKDVKSASQTAVASMTGIIILFLHEGEEQLKRQIHHFSMIFLKGIDGLDSSLVEE